MPPRMYLDSVMPDLADAMALAKGCENSSARGAERGGGRQGSAPLHLGHVARLTGRWRGAVLGLQQRCFLSCHGSARALQQSVVAGKLKRRPLLLKRGGSGESRRHLRFTFRVARQRGVELKLERARRLLAFVCQQLQLPDLR